MSPHNLLSEWARLLIGSLARAGVREAVVSPGSRSTPFTWAALNEAGLNTRVITDERAAAFFAVGHAKMTGAPVLLICTSGSAAANYLPAIVEADRSGTPLLVLTADRPFELQAADAPQTIDQVKLYGSAVRHFFELGMPDASVGALAGLRRIAAHAALLARGPMPGPVHVNARARRPLEPATADDDAGRSLAATVDRMLAQPATSAPAPLLVPPADALERVAAACARARRGVIVCGPMSPWQAPHRETVTELSRRTGFPVLAEATSQLRFVGTDAPEFRVNAFDALVRLSSFRARFEPDVVLRIGGPPTSTGWRELMARAAAGADDARRARADDARHIEEHVIAPNGWSDPHSAAASMLIGTPEPTLRALLEHIGSSDVDETWRGFLRRAEEAAHGALRTRAEFDEGIAVRTLLAVLPADAVLAVGNSLPVREVDTFSTAAGQPIAVWSQRGANGIDGLIAGACGAAAAVQRPTALLLGDVSALHDIGSLAIARECAQPLAIVVLDNGGGRIFEQLPLAQSGAADAHWPAWLTPPRLDFEAAARAFDIEYARVEDAPGLAASVEATFGRPGAALLHVVVDGERTIPASREYWADVEHRVASLP